MNTHLAVVDADNTSNHLWDDNHVTQMRLDNSGLLIGGCLLLRLAEFFDKSHGTALETPLEASASTGVDELNKLVR